MGGLSICDKDNGRERLEVSGFIVKELDLEMMCTTIHKNIPLKKKALSMSKAILSCHDVYYCYVVMTRT